jgi:hypothetical protein
MTYQSPGRSMFVLILAAVFVGFSTGFLLVLCFSNYFRAKRAMDRQRQKRLARLSNGAGNGVVTESSVGVGAKNVILTSTLHNSSDASNSFEDDGNEQRRLMESQSKYSHQQHPQVAPTRRRNLADVEQDLMIFEKAETDHSQWTANIMSV